MGTFVGATASSSTASATTHTVPYPGGLQANDLLLLEHTYLNTATPTDPAGWTFLATATRSTVTSRLLYRVATGSESGTITLTSSAANRQSGVMAAYRGFSAVGTTASRNESVVTDIHASPSVSFSGVGTIVTFTSERQSTGSTSAEPPFAMTRRAQFGTGSTSGTFSAVADNLAYVTSPNQPESWQHTVASSVVVTWTLQLIPVAPPVNGFASKMTTTTPVAWWRMADTSGNVMTDSSGNARHGEYGADGGLWSPPTLAQPGLLLDGDTNKAVTYTASANNQVSQVPGSQAWMSRTAFTAHARFKPLDTTGDHVIFGPYRNNGSNTRDWVLFTSGQRIFFQYYIGGGTDNLIVATASLTANAIYSVAVTFASGTLRIYVNGTERDSPAVSFYGTSTAPFLIGAQWAAGGGDYPELFFDGSIDEVAWWNRALTANEVSGLHEAATFTDASLPAVVNAVKATATATAAPAPTVNATATATHVAATATAQSPAPVAGVSMTTAHTVATASASTPAPTLSTSTTVAQTGSAVATAATAAPAIDVANPGEVSHVAATATAGALAPTLAADVLIESLTSTASAATIEPVTAVGGGGGSVTTPSASASAATPEPVVQGITTTPRKNRWILRDPATGEAWEFSINPNKMTSPHSSRNIRVFTTPPFYNPAIEARGGMARVFEGNKEPHEWSFGGVIRTEAQYRSLLYWTRKVSKVHVTDHLGRTWVIRFKEFNPDEKRPTARRAWRFDYEIKAMMYGELT